MLSEEKISTENPKPIRIKFRKVGMLKYISHLDLQRTFARVLTRSGIPVWYTQGFNPHIKMVFSLPLSVGSEGECEYLDIKITEQMTFGEMKYRLDTALTDELSVIDIYEPRDDFHDIAYAGYDIVLRTPRASEELASKTEKLLRHRFCCGSGVSFFDGLTFPFFGKSFFLPFYRVSHAASIS